MKGKNKGQAFVVSCEVYPFEVLFSFGETDEQFLKTAAKYIAPAEYDELKEDKVYVLRQTTQAKTMMSANGQIIARFRDLVKTPKQKGFLAHEVFHIVEFLFRHINMPLGIKSSEAYAYLTGFLTTKVYEKI